MSKEICRYHNDLNKIQLPNFSEIQLDIFYSILFKMKGRKQGELVKFDANEVLQMIGGGKGRSKEDLLGTIISLFDKLAKADFKRLIEHKDSGLTERVMLNLFKTEKIFYYTDSLTFAEVQLEMNEHFEYLLNELLKDYTEFELAELVALSGKYTKLLYTHLKQFRTTGKWVVEWDEFRRVMDIPQGLNPSDIDKILKHSIKELTAERTLLDQKRIPFKNLKFSKLTRDKEPNRKRLKPCYIEFAFSNQEITKTLKDKLKGLRWTWNDKIYQVANVKKQNNKIVVECHKLDSNLMVASGNLQRFNFLTYDSAKETIKSNLYKTNQ